MLRISLIVFLCFVGLMIASFVLFYIYRDRISEEVVLSLNQHQDGEVSFSEISFTPFIHFPDVSLRIEDLVLTYDAYPDSAPVKDTIGRIENFYVAVDMTDLLIGELNVSKLTASNGSIFLKMVNDSTLNLLAALKPKDKGVKDPDTATMQTQEYEDPPPTANIQLKHIHFENVELKYLAVNHEDTLEAYLEDLKASLNHREGVLDGSVKFVGAISNKNLTSDPGGSSLDVGFHSSFSYDEALKIMTIRRGEVKLEMAVFELEGQTVFDDIPVVDLSVAGRDEHLSFFGYFLSETGLENLKSGETYFSGSVTGPLVGQLPQMVFAFGMKDVEVSIPDTDQHISGLKFDASFKSGSELDLSGAELSIHKLEGNLPGGEVSGTLEVRDFVNPGIAWHLDLSADITGFDEIFNIDGVQALKGDVDIYDHFEGRYDWSSGSFEEEKGESSLVFDSVSLEIPGFLDFNGVCGSLSRKLDTLEIQELSFLAGKSDFAVQGKIINWLGLLAESPQEIQMDLHLRSDTFDLPDFCSFEPRVRLNFPYRIIDVDLETQASTTREQLTSFSSNPEIRFGINRCVATIENLFPPVDIASGKMHMLEQDQRILLEFDAFDLEVASSQIRADVIYGSPSDDPDFVVVDAEIHRLNPSRVFFDEFDSIPGIADGNLDGRIQADIRMGLDSLAFESINLNSPGLDYTTSRDTFLITDMTFNGKRIYYGSEGSPLATLSAEMDLQLAEIVSNHFQLEDLQYAVVAENGAFTILPEKVQLFGEKGTGVYKARPFDEFPSYEISYRVDDFRVESFLSNVMVDTLLTGYMDLDLHVVLSDSNSAKLISGANGVIQVAGEELTLYGVDIDQVIKRFQRSQNFNLVDVGAVILAGPLGLAITKGSEFANLAFGDYGESSRIVHLVSEWDFVEGRLVVKDVAFSTEENRVACAGWVDLVSDSLNITVAVLDINGCSILSQSLYGSLEKPEYSDLQVVSTLLAPVTNLLDGALGKDCDVFYDGKLPHPE